MKLPERTGRARLLSLGVALAAVACWLTSATVGLAQLPNPVLSSVFPPGGKAGSDIEVRINGADLDDANQLIFSHPKITAQPRMTEPDAITPEARPMDNQFIVKVAGDVPPGVYEVRTVGRYGVSNPRAFHIGRYDDVAETNNRPFEAAQEVSIGAVVNGQADASNYDFFKVALKRNQRVMFDCYAERIDSRMDATLVLFDAQRKELARVRDVAGKDPVLDFTAPADGEYTVAVYDFVFAGGADYFYRLAIHDGPRIEFVFPPSAEPGKSSQFTVYGRNLPGGKPAEGLTLGGDPLEQLTVTIQAPKDEVRNDPRVGALPAPAGATLRTFEYRLDTPQGPTNPVLIGLAEAPLVIEQGPNDTPAEAQKIQPPCEVVGRFLPGHESDWYEFEATQGQVYWIDVISHRWGLDCDPFLLVQRVTKNDAGEENSQMMAQVDDPPERNNAIGRVAFDTSTDDPTWRFEAPADGLYRVMIRDQFGSGRHDPRSMYRLIIRAAAPDFQLLAAPGADLLGMANNNQVAMTSARMWRGGSTVLDVTVDRRDGFTGEVAVSVEGLPAGVTSPGAVIGGDVSTAAVVIAADENAAAWVGPIRLVGKAQIDGKEVSREARTGSLVWGTNNVQQQPPQARLTRDITLAVADKQMAPATVTIEDKVWETSKGGEVEIPVRVARRAGFSGDLKLAAVGKPNEITVADVNIKGSDGEGKVKVVLTNNNLRPGSYTFYLNSTSKYKYERNQEAVQRAEEEQKRLDGVLKAMQEQAKQAEEKLKEAQQAAQQNKDDEALQQQQAAAEQARNEAQELVKKADQMKKDADQRLTAVKNQNQSKEVNFALASAPIKLRIAPTPIRVEAKDPAAAQQGEKVEATFTVERLYGFDDQVEIVWQNPPGASGVAGKNTKIDKGQTQAQLEVQLADNATVGEHRAEVICRVRFGNLQLEERVPVVIKVEAKPQQ